ncbi:hypothetical protein GGP79_002305 [Salinibacter ruber]|nr:hypothetical protein [Salinibacter ruber]
MLPLPDMNPPSAAGVPASAMEGAGWGMVTAPFEDRLILMASF